MSRVVVTEFVSIDGVMEDPGGSEGTAQGGWALKFNRGPEGDRFKADELFASDALLLGRVTYQGFASAWPGRTDEAGFADKMNGMRKYVVSTSLTNADAGWNNTRVIRGNVFDEIAKLKKQAGGDILVAGSAQLVRGLVDHELVDEYRLMVYPIVLGTGKRLFGSNTTAALALTSAKTGGEGVLMLSYEPVRKPANQGSS